LARGCFSSLLILAVEASASAVGAGIVAVVVRFEAAAGIDPAAAVESLFGRVAAISTSEGATPMRRTCRTVTTTITAIAVHARHNRATPPARLRLGRIASAGEVGVSDGGATGPEASSADFTALEN
jgi:hypothetical protein